MAGCSTTSFLLSAADVSWGRREETCVTVNVAAAALDGKYFLLEGIDDDFGTDVPYYVWFNLDAGSVDPAPAGRTAIEVAVTTGEAAADVAAALLAAVEAEAAFRASAGSIATQISIQSEYKGKVAAASADVDTTFTFERNVEGAGGDLGKTSGGVEITMETTTAPILADQTGQIVQDEFLTGQTIEVSMSLLEMTEENWERVVGSVTGDVYTPAGGTQLVGFGEDRLYASLFDLGGELVLHPSRFAESDRSKNITLWKSAPKPASINFSGEEPQLMEVTFTALADRSIQSAINLMAFGDNEQDVRA